MNKNTGILLLMASVGLIFVAIIFTTIIDSSRSSRKDDIRARASKSGSLILIGRVNIYDNTQGALLVNGLAFEDNPDKILGNANTPWKITPPVGFNPSQFPSGIKIRISALPESFQITNNSVTAGEITKK